jgi:transposase-like protein
MKDILRKSPIERLCVSVSITPQEMALALAGLNPLTRISDVPEEYYDYVDHTRRAIARALKVYRDKKITTDEACNALDILLAAFPFVEESTPEIITQKVTEAIDDLRGTKGWDWPLNSRQLVSLKLVIVLILVFRLVVGVRMIDVLGPEKRRRRSVQEKIAIVQQSFEPGMTVSLVARQHGVAASQLFLWRKQYQEGSLTAVAAGEQVVPAGAGICDEANQRAAAPVGQENHGKRAAKRSR